jgi:DNA polymerase-3 subunit delta'
MPLGLGAIRAAVASAGSAAEAPDLALSADLAEGSLRRAILLFEEDGADTYREFVRLAARLPDLDVQAMHAFADKVSRRGADDAYQGFLDLVFGWLGRRVRGLPEPEEASLPQGVPLARWAEVWEKVEQISAEADEYNLDRKQVVLNILMTLARATRM